MSKYIDSEAFFKVINTLPYKDTSYPDASAYNGAISDVADMLTHFPAADVAEVRHGRWEIEAEFKYKRGGRNTEAKQIFGTEWRTMQRLKCSVCGMVVLVDDTIKYEYCPHCGARCEE